MHLIPWGIEDVLVLVLDVWWLLLGNVSNCLDADRHESIKSQL
jgi:hypothetical protein